MASDPPAKELCIQPTLVRARADTSRIFADRLDQPLLRIFLIDDDPAAAVLTRFALEESVLDAELTAVESLQEARCRLLSGRQADHLPDLVLLDLNLRDGSGHDLLAWMKQEPRLTDIPVVILSTSSYPPDVARSESLGAADYIVKPHDIDELIAALNRLTHLVASRR